MTSATSSSANPPRRAPGPDDGSAQQVPFLTLTNWVRAASQFGIPIEEVFKEVGVPTDLLHPETVTVQPQTIAQMMHICVAESHRRRAGTRAAVPHFPFVLGESFAFEYLSDVDTFLATSPSLRASLRVFDWVRLIVNPQIEIELQEDAAHDEAALVFRLRRLAGEERQADTETYFIESLFAAVMKFSRLLLGDPPPFTRLEFAHVPPPHAALYDPFFRLPVRFGRPRHRIVLPATLLDAPLQGAFPSLNQQAEQRVEQRLAQMPKPGELVAAMEQAWAARPELLGRNIADMAAHLHLHERGLQRRLRALGHRYVDLQAQYKFRLARQWLNEAGMSVETVSERLGFADRRSFTEAFKRWSGHSPSKFRKGSGFP